MQIEFAPSERSTIGVEWELALVDSATGDLVQVADEVLREVGTPDGREQSRRLADALQLGEEARASLSATLRPGVAESTPVSVAAPGWNRDPSLPGEPTPIIGRERDLEVLCDLLATPGTQSLTLAGPGGVGKTRLALSLARRVADRYRDGAVWVELAPLADHTLVLPTVARAVGLQFGRIQFTPDLMPGDIIGANLFSFQTSQFSLTRGPIFTDLLLADEINRTPPKTQAALLEAMQERTVTIDGESLPLSDRFMVVATQNPIEQQGVYPLPEAQLDRFLFKQTVDYPSAAEERKIIATHGARASAMEPEGWGVEARTDAAKIGEAIAAVGSVRLVDEVIDYIAALVRGTRDVADLESGASPRAGAMLAGAARAHAALDGRDFVIPDDVKKLAPALLRHRLILSPAAEIDGRMVEEVVQSIIETIEAPR